MGFLLWVQILKERLLAGRERENGGFSEWGFVANYVFVSRHFLTSRVSCVKCLNTLIVKLSL